MSGIDIPHQSFYLNSLAWRELIIHIIEGWRILTLRICSVLACIGAFVLLRKSTLQHYRCVLRVLFSKYIFFHFPVLNHLALYNVSVH